MFSAYRDRLATARTQGLAVPIHLHPNRPGQHDDQLVGLGSVCREVSVESAADDHRRANSAEVGLEHAPDLDHQRGVAASTNRVLVRIGAPGGMRVVG